MPRPVAVVQAPSVLGQFPGGVETAPAALLRAGLTGPLSARDAGEVVPPPYDPEVDGATGTRNPQQIAAYTLQLADAVGAVIEAGDLPLVLGGDCSILLGSLLALRRTGRYGLLFLDAHADFYQPEALPDGEAAAMDLAFATGRGPTVVTVFEGRAPLVRDEDVVVLGRRDAADADEAGSRRVEDTDIEVIDLDEIRRTGMDTAVAQALTRLTRPELDGFWIHVDVDVLHDGVMPALDYRMGGGGLELDELWAALSAALATGRAAGLEVTNFNATLDTDSSITRGLVDGLVSSLQCAP